MRSSAADESAAWLRCEQPAEMRARIFQHLEPQQFCDQPLILKVAIQDIQPYSVLVSWQGRDHTGLSGFRVLYQALDSTVSSGGSGGSAGSISTGNNGHANGAGYIMSGHDLDGNVAGGSGEEIVIDEVSNVNVSVKYLHFLLFLLTVLKWSIVLR